MIILKLQIVIIFLIVYPVWADVKFTNVKCIEFDKSFATIPLCELKLIKRGVVALNLNVTLHKVPVNNVSVNFELMKRANGYRPFMYNMSGDFCKTMRHNKMNSFLYLGISILHYNSNINHTCPYDHDILVKNLILREEMFKLLPLPSGDYLLNLRVAAYNDWKACVKFYFNVKE